MSIADIFNWFIHTNLLIVIPVVIGTLILIPIVGGFIVAYFHDDEFKKSVHNWVIFFGICLVIGLIVYEQYHMTSN